MAFDKEVQTASLGSFERLVINKTDSRTHIHPLPKRSGPFVSKLRFTTIIAKICLFV